MSIRVTSKVWEHSAHKGTTLLVLLSLADQANDEGWCWPSIGTIAAKSRMSERQVQRAIQSLAASGEIEIAAGAGPNKVNRYRVLVDRLGCGAAIEDGAHGDADSEDEGGDKMSPQGVTPVSPPDAGEGVTPTVVEGDIHGQKGVTPVSPKPSLNRQEPSARGRASAASRGDARAPAAAWAAVRGRLRGELGGTVFERWFGEIELGPATDRRVVLHAPGAFVRDWVASRHGGLLRALWREALGHDIEVDVVAVPEGDLFAAPPAPAVEPGAEAAACAPAGGTPPDRVGGKL